MAIVCVGSARGAPGTTTVASLVASSWPRPVVLVEADPDGGVLAVRHGLSRQPGLAALAAALRREPSSAALLECAQAMPDNGLPTVVAPEAGEIATSILSDVAGDLGPWLASPADLDVVIDCGRLGPRSPVIPVLRSADDVLVIARPNADELHAAAHRLRALQAVNAATRLVLVGERPYDAAAVASHLGIEPLGVVADDPRAARVVGGAGLAIGVRRSMLVRSVRELADTLADRLAAGAGRADDDVADTVEVDRPVPPHGLADRLRPTTARGVVGRIGTVGRNREDAR